MRIERQLERQKAGLNENPKAFIRDFKIAHYPDLGRP